MTFIVVHVFIVIVAVVVVIVAVVVVVVAVVEVVIVGLVILACSQSCLCVVHVIFGKIVSSSFYLDDFKMSQYTLIHYVHHNHPRSIA